MTALLAVYKVKHEFVDEVGEALRAMATAVERDEPGCLLYGAARSEDSVDTFFLFEVYTDKAALEAHRETPHFRRIIEGYVVPRLDSRVREPLSLVAVSPSGLLNGGLS